MNNLTAHRRLLFSRMRDTITYMKDSNGKKSRRYEHEGY